MKRVKVSPQVRRRVASRQMVKAMTHEQRMDLMRSLVDGINDASMRRLEEVALSMMTPASVVEPELYFEDFIEGPVMTFPYEDVAKATR